MEHNKDTTEASDILLIKRIPLAFRTSCTYTSENFRLHCIITSNFTHFEFEYNRFFDARAGNAILEPWSVKAKMIDFTIDDEYV